MEMPAVTETRKMKRMQRSAFRFGLTTTVRAAAALALGLTAMACSEEGVGDPCTPEAIPVEGNKPGFKYSETYLEASSVQCRSRMCLVYKLDNGTNEEFPADPREDYLCGHPKAPAVGCVHEESLPYSVHCTCKCGGPKTSEQCKCPDGYTCTQLPDAFEAAGEGIRGKYCVRDCTPQAKAQGLCKRE